MEWDRLFSGKNFITDLGETQEAEVGGESVVVAQYAAWAPVAGSKGHQIVEIGDDLPMLMEKYHIPADRVCTLIQT